MAVTEKKSLPCKELFELVYLSEYSSYCLDYEYQFPKEVKLRVNLVF